MYHKWRLYDVCFLRYGARQTEFFVILDHFLPFYPTKQSKKSKIWKKEKNSVPELMVICYTVPEIWRVTNAIFIFHLFWAIFCSFTPLTARKIKILKKWNNTPGIIILHMCTKNYDHMMYGSWDMVRDGHTDGKIKFFSFFSRKHKKFLIVENFIFFWRALVFRKFVKQTKSAVIPYYENFFILCLISSHIFLLYDLISSHPEM